MVVSVICRQRFSIWAFSTILWPFLVIFLFFSKK